jgi:hypothetical protein
MSIPLLSETFPDLWALAVDLANELKIGKYQGWATLKPRLQDLLAPRLFDSCVVLIPGWGKIAVQENGLTAKHTLLVLSTCLNLPEYQSASSATQHEIEWAALLHDVDKDYERTPPLKDASHPFRSAAKAVTGLPRLGFHLQTGVSLKDLDDWAALVAASERPENGQFVHDHTYLAEIVSRLHHHWGTGTPASRILKVILFHQSLPTLKDWTNPVLLNDAELCVSLTPADLDVLLPLLIADSDAWNLFDEPRFAYLEELRANNAETRRRLNQELL